MRKGQLSVEFIFIAVLVLTFSFAAFKMYQEAGFELVSESSLKSFVDWELAKARFDSPVCGDAYFAGLERNLSAEGHIRDYWINSTNQRCVPLIFTPQERMDFSNGTVHVSLGCDYYGQHSCKGYVFEVYG